MSPVLCFISLNLQRGFDIELQPVLEKPLCKFRFCCVGLEHMMLVLFNRFSDGAAEMKQEVSFRKTVLGAVTGGGQINFIKR
jgi:hypothetical protein